MPAHVKKKKIAQVASSSNQPCVKQKWDNDLLNKLLPDGPPDEAAAYGSLEFDEVLDETVRFNSPLIQSEW
ncbi:uncharacterized protein F5891DRAFT_1191693 [Suillus fuscotomentosus]|uniref:Uncharacterized protein n=1 Tax=Suillus fuscotomentosus TaxID=1912939 RepID=A0AAD4E3E1_9AGAM|nr:uncharacterized protein F5891DRAFT_1191693 [Suillus fuscotomentosus]KAG1897769.1 hypothetical protein F5891DRAFT_1191693 [Suillus fuscotomentosus]